PILFGLWKNSCPTGFRHWEAKSTFPGLKGQHPWWRVVGNSGTILRMTQATVRRDDARWEPSLAEKIPVNIYGVYFASADKGWVVGETKDDFGPNNQTIWITNDGGSKWHRPIDSEHVLYLYSFRGVSFSADGLEGLAVGSGGVILRTNPSDGGE